MKQIELSQGYVALIDDEDFDMVSVFTWSVEVRSNTCYASTVLADGSRMRMHRLVMGEHDEAVHVDHEDRDGLNNQRHNLRAANHSKNAINAEYPQGPNGSGYRGVYKYHRDETKFTARIRDSSGKKLHLGIFNSDEEAARAYDAAAREHHGAFAVLNFEDAGLL